MQQTQPSSAIRTTIALTWCIAWGIHPEPQANPEQLHQARQAILDGKPQHILPDLQPIYQQVQTLLNLEHPSDLTLLKAQQPELWEQPANIGLVYGGATKIKGYVFESAKLSDIRGASAILDQINLIDLPAFFKKVDIATENPKTQAQKALAWLNVERNFPGLADALIPELIIYSTGGNILALCPAAYVDLLANAIEKRYSEETLTANACAVGRAYRPLEIKFGVLQNDIAITPWLDWYQTNATHPLIESYYGKAQGKSDAALTQQFQQRKNFSEIVGQLTADFQRRRNGNNEVGSNKAGSNRPSRRYPPMFETHPYLRRDGSEKRSVLGKVSQLPSGPHFSEAQARKEHIGRLSKRIKQNEGWFVDPSNKFNKSLYSDDDWYTDSQTKRSDGIQSWVEKFECFLEQLPPAERDRYYGRFNPNTVEEARYLSEIGHASNPGKGYVAYIYADGNNMGGYIQNKIASPQAYRQFSKDIFCATKNSVYLALAQHLHPVQVPGDPDEDTKRQKDTPIHPFEIITIGGDDVLLIVPASSALAIAQTLGEQFENILLNDPSLPDALKGKVQGDYGATPLPEGDRDTIHRYRPNQAPTTRCQLSTSSGVLITQDKTPIYYAQSLTNQLLKSAKDKAKSLKKSGYLGGTVDFLVLKNVTMVSSDVKAFRKEGLTIERHHGSPNKPIKKDKQPDQILKLHAAPYTLHELQGLIDTLSALKASKYPRSQLYQVRSLLEQGKRTAMLNYHYFRARLSKRGKQGKPSQQALLIERFEQAWCKAKSNSGTLSPWISILRKPEPQTPPTPPEELPIPTYETIWRELVDLYPFVLETDVSASNNSPADEDATAQQNAPQNTRGRNLS